MSLSLVASLQAETSNTLCVMSFNLRFASNNKPHAWPDRRPVMHECIQSVSPDIIGTQEGLYPQIKNIASDLPDYDWIGLGREGGSRSEFMAVFYRKARLEPMEYDHFWLSDTPDVMGSSTWGNKNRRMVTWVRFRDRQTGKEFYFFNTHFDHEVQKAREKSAELVRQRIAGLKTDLPVILGGDFNGGAGTNAAYKILTADDFLKDTWITAEERRGEVVGTFHGYHKAVPNGPRIDWILTRGPVTAEAAQIVTFSKNGEMPSDHFPIVTWLELR
jgi:endonuclease/exonuclease/phosphatase family metal-dependent hydrolase